VCARLLAILSHARVHAPVRRALAVAEHGRARGNVGNKHVCILVVFCLCIRRSNLKAATAGYILIDRSVSDMWVVQLPSTRGYEWVQGRIKDRTLIGGVLVVWTTGFSQRTTSLLAIAKGASPVTEHEFKLFQRAMGEQGQTKSSVSDVIAAAGKKGNLDAW